MLTERARREACRWVDQDRLDVAAVATTLGVGWGTVMRAVREYGQPLVEDPARLAGVHAVGVDETAFLAANATHATLFVTGILALPGPGRPSAQLLDVMPGRTKAVVQQWFEGRDPGWRDAIPMCSLDPFGGHATALSTSLPHAERVLDAFHAVRLGSSAVDDVRRRRQQETLGRRGHRDDPLYRARRLLRRDFTTLTERQWTRLENASVRGDRSGQLTNAWIVAQEIQLLYRRSAPSAPAPPGPLRPLRSPRAAPARPHAGCVATRTAPGVHPDRQAPHQQRADRSRQRDQEPELHHSGGLTGPDLHKLARQQLPDA